MNEGASQPLISHVRVLTNAVNVETTRSGGPGGQHANTSDSAVVLRVALWGLVGMDGAALERLRGLAGRRVTADDELLLRCSDERSQHANRERAWQRLRGLVQQALQPPKKRRPTRPTRGSVKRRLASKKERGERKRRRSQDHQDGWD